MPRDYSAVGPTLLFTRATGTLSYRITPQHIISDQRADVIIKLKDNPEVENLEGYPLKENASARTRVPTVDVFNSLWRPLSRRLAIASAAVAKKGCRVWQGV